MKIINLPDLNARFDLYFKMLLKHLCIGSCVLAMLDSFQSRDNLTFESEHSKFDLLHDAVLQGWPALRVRGHDLHHRDQGEAQQGCLAHRLLSRLKYF